MSSSGSSSRGGAAAAAPGHDHHVGKVEKGLFHQPKEGKITMVLAFDDSEQSLYALEWTLDHFYSPATGGGMGFQLVIVHAKRALSAINVSGPGTSVEEVLQDVEIDQKRLATKTVDKARAICAAHSVPAVVEIMEGSDAKHVLMDAVTKHHADILIVGSDGYNNKILEHLRVLKILGTNGTKSASHNTGIHAWLIREAFMGSVSDHMAHHAQCSVMIVKKPKQKDDKKQPHKA